MTEAKKESDPNNHETPLAQGIDAQPPGMEFDEYFEAQYLRTGNPLFVWQALNSLSVYGQLWAAHNETQASTPLAIPVWCIRYLMEAASRMSNLCRLLDERRRPDDSEGYSALVKWASNPTLTASDAAHRVNDALRIDGSSFTKLSSAQKRAEAFRDFENLVAAGLPVNEAEKEIGKKFGWDDERTVRRYMAEQRNAGKSSR